MFRRELAQTIIGIAVVAAIIALGYFEYHQRLVSDAIRSLIVERAKPSDRRLSGPGAVGGDVSTFKTIPLQNPRLARTETRIVIWDTQKINGFWKGVTVKTFDTISNLVSETRKPEAGPAPEPAPKVTTDKKGLAPAPDDGAAVPASPPRKETRPESISEVRREVTPAFVPGIVSFAINPWGEIYVNGEKRGVNPPMRELELVPGKYEVEVRNSTFPAHVQTISVEAGTRIQIRHQFR